MPSLQWLLIVAVLCALVGCGSDKATVSGTVTWEGAPLERGFITFVPADVDSTPEGGTIENGKFHVTDIPPGKKTVEIIGVKAANFAATSEEMQRRAAETAAGGDKTGLVDRADVIPPDAEGNRQTVELAPGSQTKDFVLKKAK